MLMFHGSAEEVPAYSYYELTAASETDPLSSPFTDARLEATVTAPSGRTFDVEGFCDSDDGTVFRLRVMPSEVGTYAIAARFTRARLGTQPFPGEQRVDGAEAPGDALPETRSFETSFSSVASDHPGMLEVDPDYPNHFRYSQSREHCFWNGTTAYYLMGWRDDSVIDAALSRFASKRVNRVRVLLYGREYDRPWGQPVVQSEAFRLTLNPWLARFPDDRSNPEFDLTRFDLNYWRKFERMLSAADHAGIQISICFFIGAQPLAVPFAMWSEDEVRYYRYAIARLAAFPNVSWDIGNEHDFHRDNRFWVNSIGEEIARRDPYSHVCGVHNKPYFDAGPWLSVQLHQIWDAGLGDRLADLREKQAAAGRVIPQIIEEYGYEDLWEGFPGQRSAETRRRVCWEIAMAGCYQTNGETARTGTGEREDSGGGWISGRGDNTMTMFDAIVPMLEFFGSFDWWRLNPDPDALLSYDPGRTDGLEYFYPDGRRAADRPAQVLSSGADRLTVVYLPYGGRASVALAGSGPYRIEQWNPRTGAHESLDCTSADSWTSPWSDGPQDIAYLITV